MKSKPYRGVFVNQIDPLSILAGRDGQAVDVGLDIGKRWIYVVLRWKDKDFGRPWKVRNPTELSALTRLLGEVGQGRRMTIAMEPTGTYGDALRQALADAKLAVRRVSPKAAKDYAEIFDGTHSQHDGKDASVIAELASLGRSWEWDFVVPCDGDQEINYLVDAIECQRRQTMPWAGRLEALASRHWPEATELIDATSGTLLRVFSTYGSPAKLAADPEALSRLRRWGGVWLSEDKAKAILASAKATAGVRVGEWDERRLRETADEIRKCKLASLRHGRRLKAASFDNEVIRRMGSVVGVVTACVLWKHLGDPSDYHCGAAYRKAMGLNLKERSSGQWQGQLKISKRGSAQVRRWLYLAALRLVRLEPGIRAWYAQQKRRRQGVGTPAIVGVMRKLALVLWQVGAKGQTYSAELVFAALREDAAATK